MVILKEVEIKRCHSLSHELLQFEQNNFATILNCASTSTNSTALITAIQPFFYKNTISIPMDGDTEAERGESFVRIKFLLPNEQGGEDIVVDAMRLCHKPEELYYYFGEEQFIESIEEFYERCRFHVTSFYPFLDDVFSNEHKNLMHHWFARACPLRIASEGAFEILTECLELSEPNADLEAKYKEILQQAEESVYLEILAKIIKKRAFVQIANEIGTLFNRLTFGQYYVRFNIPISRDDLDMKKLKWNDLDFEYTVTKVNKRGEDTSYLWNHSKLGLQFLLKVAQTIAYAKHLEIGFAFLPDTTDLQEYQNVEMIQEAINQSSSQETEADWTKKNFLKQITDICNEMKVMIVLNHQGIIALPPDNTNIVKSRSPTEDNTASMYVCTDLQPMSLNEFTQKFMLPIAEDEISTFP